MADYGNNQPGPARWVYCVELDQYGAPLREVWVDHNRRDDRIALGQRCREAFEAGRAMLTAPVKNKGEKPVWIRE